ncbi:jg7960 [Pararge aegeria aegeria]|uniref:Jg7960 protein n=1 Tax=Pararge aegeria aegeria TaxID=348720 RepID=A0A8S4SIL4_9NEOP|nr:jg7960 [Pararge aegeria aegeria]
MSNQTHYVQRKVPADQVRKRSQGRKERKKKKGPSRLIKKRAVQTGTVVMQQCCFAAENSIALVLPWTSSLNLRDETCYFLKPDYIELKLHLQRRQAAIDTICWLIRTD